MVIEFPHVTAQSGAMRYPIFLLALCGALTLTEPAQAADCFADYKAKQDRPLKLHYGVMQLQGACRRGAARSEIQARLAQQGWTLLNVVSVFGPEGLQERRANAGVYFLRF